MLVFVWELVKKFVFIFIIYIDCNFDQLCYDFDEDVLQELFDSIKIYGIIQLFIVCYLEFKCYQIIFGECCWCVLKLVGFIEVLVYICVVNDQMLLEMVIIENIQWEDLNLMEIVNFYKCLKMECELLDEEFVQCVGKKWSIVINYLGLFDLYIVVQDVLKKGLISMGYVKFIKGMDFLLQEGFFKEVLVKKWLVC